MSAPAPKTELMQSLGQLVRGLSALFWGLPLALVLGVQTARTDWLRPFGLFPPLAAAGLLFFGLLQLEHFQREERDLARGDRARQTAGASEHRVVAVSFFLACAARRGLLLAGGDGAGADEPGLFMLRSTGCYSG